MTITARNQARITAALASFEAGFTTKAAQKEALAALNSAFGDVNGGHHRWAIEQADAEFSHIDWEGLSDDDMRDTAIARMNAIHARHDMPFDLHQVRERHLVQFEATGDRSVVEYLLGLREAFKGAEIVRVERSENVEKVGKVRESIVALMERRKAQYVEALELGELFGGLPVTVTAHWVTNEHGTTFLRHFFYLRGKLTPLLVIIAAAEELQRRKEAA